MYAFLYVLFALFQIIYVNKELPDILLEHGSILEDVVNLLGDYNQLVGSKGYYVELVINSMLNVSQLHLEKQKQPSVIDIKYLLVTAVQKPLCN